MEEAEMIIAKIRSFKSGKQIYFEKRMLSQRVAIFNKYIKIVYNPSFLHDLEKYSGWL